MSVISFASRRKQIPIKGPAGWSQDAPRGMGAMRQAPPGIPAIGIDLGTTNTVVSIFREGELAPETLVYEGHKTIPSVVRWDAAKGHELVGRAALAVENDQKSDLIRSTKRKMGIPHAAFASAGREFTAEEAATALLRSVANHPKLKKERELHGGLWVVITVPAHFDDAARQATLDAARVADLEVLRIVNEPTAAALAYSLLARDEQEASPEQGPEQEDLVVFDFGGGTFDVSVVHREGLIFKVLASEGDMELGGDDLDVCLADILLKGVQPEFVARRSGRDSALYRHLLQIAPDVKHQLGENGVVTVAEQLPGASLSATISREDFEEAIVPTLERTLVLTEKAIHHARLRSRDVSRILLVGGSTRLPSVRKLLESYFTGCMVDCRLEPDLAVSWGAALQAAIIIGIAPETVLVDVCNHSLGIGVVDDPEVINRHYRDVQKKFGLSGDLDEEELRSKLGKKILQFNKELQKLLRVAPIIRRNSALPARKSEFFSTLFEDQPAVHVIVAQGEGETVGENRFIGSFLFELRLPCPKGSKCEIQLTYDVNGMVNIFARQLGTDNRAQARFDSRTGTVSGWDLVDGDELGSDLPESAPDSVLHADSRKSAAGRIVAVDADQSGDNPSQIGNVRTLKFGKGDETLLGSHQGFDQPPKHFGSGVPVLNAVLARGRRLMKRISEGKESVELEALLQDYQQLLAAAHGGHDNDDHIEEVEERLLELMENLERSI
jgi:molecular chaperone DnaK